MRAWQVLVLQPGQRAGQAVPPLRRCVVLKKAVLLLACACALLAAAIPAMAAVAPSRADTNTTQADTNRQLPRRQGRRPGRPALVYGRATATGGRSCITTASGAGGISSGPPPATEREPTARELRRSIRRMKRRFATWSGTYEGRATVNRFRVRHIPRVGQAEARLDRVVRVAQQPARRRWRRGVPRPLPVQLQHLARRRRMGDPAAAPRSEQTWRAWLLLSKHGSGHWPVCGQ